MSIGTKKLVHIAFVVRDLDKVVDAWTKILGIERPRIWNIPGPDVAPVLTNGHPEIYTNCRISVIQLENVTLELTQPGDEPSPWKTFLEKHGEGMMHMAFLTPDEEEAFRTIKEACGTDGYYHIGYYPDQSYSFVDTFDSLKTELNIKVDRDNREVMNKIVKNTLILTAITVVAGLLLGVVYGVTKDPIAKAQEEAKQEAFRSVLSDAETFESDTEFDADAASALLKENGYTSDDISEVAEGKDASGETVGYVVNVTSHEGYGGDIDISVGIREDGTVTGIEMLSISETAGLGMKATEPSFYNQYVNKQADKFVVSKDGGDGEQIDALSGATITSRAVTGAVNAALGYYQNAFK